MSLNFTVLVVDDERNIREGLAEAFRMDGYEALTAADGEEGLRLASSDDVDLVVTDLRMPGKSGSELLKALSARRPGVPVIVLTGHGSIATAIEAIQRGAFHYLTKPCDIPELEIYLHKAIDQRNVRRENEQLRGLIQRARDTHGIVGGSPAIRNLLNLIERMKDADAQCWSRAKAARARNWSPKPSITRASGASIPSSPSTAPRSSPNCSKTNSSAMSPERSPGP